MNHATGTSLVLSVLGDHADEIAERTSVRAEGHDLSIGRAEHCDWVLQAQGVSRQHAVVRHLNGMYFIEDRSTNGMLLNGSPLRGGEPVALGDGDRLQLDTFDILVALETPVDERADVTAPARRDGERTLQAVRTARGAHATLDPLTSASHAPSSSLIPGDGVSGAPLDPLAWFQTTMPSSGDLPPVEASGHWNHASPMTDRFDPPRVDEVAPVRGSAVLPENWDRTRSQFQMPPAGPATVETTAQPVAQPAVVTLPASIVAAVDIVPVAPATVNVTSPVPVDPVPAVPHATSSPGSIEPLFALVLDGVMDVLRARAELKNGFRLPATLIQRRENNPLKFAPNGTEALARVLASPNDAFLSGEAAITDAMDDIREHQVALLAGVRAAFEDLLAQFDPSRFEEGDTHRPRFGFGQAKGPWERYRAHFQALATDPEERFRRLFGDEFARAYEDQLVRARRDASDRSRV